MRSVATASLQVGIEPGKKFCSDVSAWIFQDVSASFPLLTYNAGGRDVSALQYIFQEVSASGRAFSLVQ